MPVLKKAIPQGYKTCSVCDGNRKIEISARGHIALGTCLNCGGRGVVEKKK